MIIPYLHFYIQIIINTPLLKNNNCPMFVQSISCRLTQRKRLPKRYIFTKKKKLSTHFQNFSLDNILKEFKLVTKNNIYICI